MSVPTAMWGGLVPDAPEYPVDTYAIGDQERSTVTVLASRDFVPVWKGSLDRDHRSGLSICTPHRLGADDGCLLLRIMVRTGESGSYWVAPGAQANHASNSTLLDLDDNPIPPPASLLITGLSWSSLTPNLDSSDPLDGHRGQLARSSPDEPTIRTPTFAGQTYVVIALLAGEAARFLGHESGQALTSPLFFVKGGS